MRLARVRMARIKKTLHRERQTNIKPSNKSQQEIKHLIIGAAKYLPKVSLDFFATQLQMSKRCKNARQDLSHQRNTTETHELYVVKRSPF